MCVLKEIEGLEAQNQGLRPLPVIAGLNSWILHTASSQAAAKDGLEPGEAGTAPHNHRLCNADEPKFPHLQMGAIALASQDFQWEQ